MKLFTTVERSLQQNCLITTSTRERPELKKVNIFGGHEYTVTKVANEWNGEWSDKSAKWKTVSDERIKKLNIVKEDGEFWMDIKHFVNYFDDISICYQSANDFAASQNQEESFWTTVCQHGEWIREFTAGGSDKETFYRNPQYLLTIEDPRSNELNDEDSSYPEKSFNTIVGLMQKHSRVLGRGNISVSAAIFPVPAGMDVTQHPMPKSFFDNSKAIKNNYSGMKRETIFNHSLSAGKYVLVPHTWKPQQEAEFFLRVFSEAAITMTCMKQIDEA
ncbi:AGAP012069-PA-like protein [Anopheles sinensis]|uniref:AGAP012069-PA-like protein n=1 Tax=Anopheles sinensis TaxID=74873 RepID=A0A084WIZ9_ANOSI|nr:AGAP012069-PA-like protein [Anopheles sinensis]